jgi:hypothetical protein
MKVLKNVVNNFDLNRFGREKNRTELKLIGLNWFLVRFGSKTKKISLVFYFGPKSDRIENAQL